jgi:hypothetical protein
VSNNIPSVGQLLDALKLSSLMALHVEVFLALTVKMMVPLFWIICITFSSHQMFLHPVSHRHDRETTDDVPYIANTNEAQEGVRAAIRAGDMKMLSVAYVSGFIARHLLCNGSCDACKACLISDAPSLTDVFISLKECSSIVQSLTYPTEKLVETVGTDVTVLEDMI